MFPLDRVMFKGDSHPYVQKLPSIRQVPYLNPQTPRCLFSLSFCMLLDRVMFKGDSHPYVQRLPSIRQVREICF